MNTMTSFRVVDSQVHLGSQGYGLAQTAYLGSGYTVLVQVEYDTYVNQSSARVSVLSNDLTWTVLASSPASEWHPHMPSHVAMGNTSAVEGVLDEVAMGLFERAIAILDRAPRSRR